jgi:hypothetical protein
MKKENILTEITESQVAEWMRAKLMAIRANGLQIHNMDIAARWPSWETGPIEPITAWCMHAHGECVACEPNCEIAVEKLSKLIYENPSAKAKILREEAARLLEKAAHFESVANGGAK